MTDQTQFACSKSLSGQVAQHSQAICRFVDQCLESAFEDAQHSERIDYFEIQKTAELVVLSTLLLSNQELDGS